jgi:hypothetical protein
MIMAEAKKPKKLSTADMKKVAGGAKSSSTSTSSVGRTGPRKATRGR